MSGLKSQYSPDTMFLSRGNESRPWYLLRWRIEGAERRKNTNGFVC